MPYYEKEQIALAREMDLLTYLRLRDPGELVDMGHGVYSTRTHDSLKISNGLWNWWSRGIGGRTALDYLIKVCGLKLPEAVAQILGDGLSSFPAQSVLPPARASPIPFQLPEANDDNRRVFAYLRSRGVDPEIINHCIKHGQLYESREHHNAVFVGYDGDTPKSASMRSTLSESTFLRDVEGSDKRFSFRFSAENENNSLYVFEGAIDLLSYLTLRKRGGQDWREVNAVSLVGIYMPRKDGSTTVPLALRQFLLDHPQVKHISLCLDADEAGSKAATGIISALPEFDVSYNPPGKGKDYNDMLCAALGNRSSVKTRGGHARE